MVANFVVGGLPLSFLPEDVTTGYDDGSNFLRAPPLQPRTPNRSPTRSTVERSQHGSRFIPQRIYDAVPASRTPCSSLHSELINTKLAAHFFFFFTFDADLISCQFFFLSTNDCLAADARLWRHKRTHRLVLVPETVVMSMQ